MSISDKPIHAYALLTDKLHRCVCKLQTSAGKRLTIETRASGIKKMNSKAVGEK